MVTIWARRETGDGYFTRGIPRRTFSARFEDADDREADDYQVEYCMLTMWELAGFDEYAEQTHTPKGLYLFIKKHEDK